MAVHRVRLFKITVQRIVDGKAAARIPLERDGPGKTGRPQIVQDHEARFHKSAEAAFPVFKHFVGRNRALLSARRDADERPGMGIL